MASSAPDVPEDVVDLDALDDTGAHRHLNDIWQYYKKIKLDKAHAEVNQADAMELCSTSKVLELLAEYYRDDRKEINSNFLLNDKSTNNDIYFDHPAFAGTASAVSCAGLARAAVESNDEQLDISNLTSNS